MTMRMQRWHTGEEKVRRKFSSRRKLRTAERGFPVSYAKIVSFVLTQIESTFYQQFNLFFSFGDSRSNTTVKTIKTAFYSSTTSNHDALNRKVWIPRQKKPEQQWKTKAIESCFGSFQMLRCASALEKSAADFRFFFRGIVNDSCVYFVRNICPGEANNNNRNGRRRGNWLSNRLAAACLFARCSRVRKIYPIIDF
jgi:hypothetical protein